MDTSSDRYFKEVYDEVMYSGATGKYSDFVHRVMERRYHNVKTRTVLELGAGSGQHAPYVVNDVDLYIESDLDPTLSKNTSDTINNHKIIRQRVDAQNLSEFKDNSIARIIATCLLVHLSSPEAALEEWRRVVEPKGYLTIYIPTEPGMFLRLVRHLIMVPKSRKHGQDHLGTVYRDHRNHYPMMRIILKDVFKDDEVKKIRFPFPGIGWNFNLFEVYHIRIDANKINPMKEKS
jgi:phosphatidylethanolamine/phosphatidyl-N-methylethanolamine N-methyltransferase